MKNKKNKKKINLIAIGVLNLFLIGSVGVLTVPMIESVKVQANEYVSYYNTEEQNKIEFKYNYKYKLPDFIKEIKEKQFINNTKFYVENPEIVQLNNEDQGSFSGLASGETKIHIKNNKTKYKEDVSVSVYGKLESISLKDITLSVNNPQTKVEYDLIPRDSEPQDFNIEIEDESIAKIDGENIIMVAPGTTAYSVSNIDGTISKKANITVLSAPDELIADNIELAQKETKKINAKTNKEDADIGNKLSFKIKDEKIAKINDDGTLTGLKPGKTELTISNDTNLKKKVDVKVLRTPQKLIVENVSLENGEKRKLDVKTDIESPETGTKYKYSSDNKDVVKVNKKGKLTAVAGGNAKITIENEYGLKTTCNVTVSAYPMVYEDETGKITITKEWFENAWCYAAHLEFSDYSRFGTYCANDSYGSESTVSAANEQLGSILCVNGCYSAAYLNYPVMRSGAVKNDKACTVPGVYSRQTGKFSSPANAGVYGAYLSGVSNSISDTFCFGPEFLVNGSITCGDDASRAQRTFIGTNGNPGDIYLVVSDGRMNDGESAGLTGKQCARYLQEKGCTFGIPLDGGGSSEMIFKDKILNAVAEERNYLVDFVYFK